MADIQAKCPDVRLIELRAEIEHANVAFGSACSAYSEAHYEAQRQAEARGEDAPEWDNGSGCEFDIKWGMLDMRHAYERTSARCNALLKELADTPAQTIDGILAKLEIWQRMHLGLVNIENMALDEFSLHEERMGVSALRDARTIVEARNQ